MNLSKQAYKEYLTFEDKIKLFISEHFLEILLIFLAIILIKLIIRELRCWYWKINDKISLQNQQINLLNDVIENQDEEISILREILERLINPDGIKIEFIENTTATEENDVSK